MHENAFALAGGALDEIEDLLRRFVMLIEQGLVLRVLPEEREVDDADRLPKVADLLAGAVDDVIDFICNHELQILPHTHHAFC